MAAFFVAAGCSVAMLVSWINASPEPDPGIVRILSHVANFALAIALSVAAWFSTNRTRTRREPSNR